MLAIINLVCDCDAAGTQDINSTCMPFGGGCGPCQPGVTGLRCDSCLNGFFGFSSNGCEGKSILGYYTWILLYTEVSSFQGVKLE